MRQQILAKLKDRIMSNKLEIIKKCEYCGKRFVAQRTTTRYCSHQCNSRAYKEDKKKRKVVGLNYAVMQEIERISERFEEIQDKEFLSVVETAFLLSIERTTVYRYLHRGQLKGIRMDGKTFIRRSDIDAMFDNAEKYESKARPSVEAKPLTEFYTVAEIKEKFNIKESWLFKVARENDIPKTLIRGKSYFSKKHIDKYFEKKGINDNQDIREWYTVADIMGKYGLTLNAIYSFVSENQIPKKKDGRMVLYSKHDFDVAKGYEKPKEPEYYSVEEAMEQYSLTRDALYHYIKYHNIPKVKDGRYIKVSKPELDKLFNPQITQ